MLREWILAVLFAVSAAMFAVGAGFEWGVGVALMVGAALLAGLSVLVIRDDATAPVADTAVEDDELAPASAKRSTAGAQTPAEMMAALSPIDVAEVSVE